MERVSYWLSRAIEQRALAVKFPLAAHIYLASAAMCEKNAEYWRSH